MVAALGVRALHFTARPRSHTTATSEAALDDGTLIEDIEVDADNKVVS